MGTWGASIFSDDMALDIRREYSVLLSVGKSSEEAEEMLINYYSNILNCNDPDEDVFWYVLALCEWKKGRLSSTVKEKALSALENSRDLNRWNTSGNEKNYKQRKKALKELRETLLSPMPTAKKVKKPTVHHCPWKVGSLLAYRIVSDKGYLRGHPCSLKYVLLRVVRVDKHPVSKLFDTEYYEESMMVGLYDWIGDEIPDPKIVRSLKYIPIKEYAPTPIAVTTFESLFNGLPREIKEVSHLHFKGSTEKCVWLDWRPGKDEPGDITFLDCDDAFCNNIPEFFKPIPCSNTYTHFFPFDISLSKIFDPKTGDGLGDKGTVCVNPKAK